VQGRRLDDLVAGAQDEVPDRPVEVAATEDPLLDGGEVVLAGGNLGVWRQAVLKGPQFAAGRRTRTSSRRARSASGMVQSV
jgi:hypothetical protein